MVDGALLDALEGVARHVRRSDKPFGGIQLVLSGAQPSAILVCSEADIQFSSHWLYSQQGSHGAPAIRSAARVERRQQPGVFTATSHSNLSNVNTIPREDG